ncbi:Hsp20/alpha crystallin family protein [Staphylococcus kloosii]|uniref:Hsp20/alpha crystallin family protein n=1 Tax=Staphylococcus kloosii TaxID=29384 RepID=UPI000D1E9317|nr:Hsp20/alpha crystallin family protein [Staphylococcus kloosii]PTJ79134.1 heat-shock protein [Staphylococcus kloosii]
MAFEMKPFNNSFFDVNPSDFFKDFGRQFFDQFPSQNIKTDIKELDDAYEVEAELPGMDKDNIQLQFDNNILTIAGKQTVENEEQDDEGRVIQRERSYSNVSRQFSFNNIDKDNITASYNNGMLHVKLPKSQQKDTSSNIQID